MTKELEPDVVESIKNGRKIEAIKKLRQSRGLGLKEAKELVDAYCVENEIPVSSAPSLDAGNSIVILILLAGASYLLYKSFA